MVMNTPATDAGHRPHGGQQPATDAGHRPPARPAKRLLVAHCNKCGISVSLTEARKCHLCGSTLYGEYDLLAKPRPKPQPRLKTERKRPMPYTGYDRLEGDWLTYYNVAEPFARTVPDKEDLLHTIIAGLADACHSKPDRPPADNQGWLYRIASNIRADYWREHYQLTNGVDCGRCSSKARLACKRKFETGLWQYTQCPKLVRIESLNKPIIDSDGSLTELGELIADDKAIDLDAWLDARTFLLNSPKRLLEIAGKLQAGDNLTPADSRYLYKLRKREQIKLDI